MLCNFSWPDIATQSICADLLGILKEILALRHRWVIYPVKPFLTLFNWGLPDMAGYIMSFCTSHFSSILLIGQF